jgi:hypothetical protein
MKKAILVLICAVATLSAFAQDAVSISHNLPATISPGQTIDADFTISKGSVGGFAKYQMDLPFGFVATNIDSKGGNFTFENQRVKIVWVSVPPDASFSFKFKVTVPANAMNSCTVSAKFFYLENNVKKEVEMASHNMRIEGGGMAGTTSTPTETVTPTTTTTETVTSNPTTTYTTEPVATNTVSATPTETVAPTTTTTETVTSNPTTTYTTEPVATNTVSTTPTETVSSTPTETVTSTPTETVSTTSSYNSGTTSTERTNSTSSSSDNSSSSSSGSGMTYKVQLGAFSNYPSKSKFPGISLNIVQEGGYYKALTGNFNSMDEAMSLKSKLASKGYDCFVVFYQNGQRVGIQK